MRTSTRHRSVAVLGYRGVGKSAVTIQFVESTFVDSYHPTIENTFHKTFQYRGQPLELAIRDTSGQDESTMFHPRIAVGIHGYLLVYSVESRRSFEIIKYIHDKLLTSLMGHTMVARVLVGNKRDLDSERMISYEEGEALAAKWGCGFVECSAKTNDNIETAFQKLVIEIRKEEVGETLRAWESINFCLRWDACPVVKDSSFLQTYLKALLYLGMLLGLCLAITGIFSCCYSGGGAFGYILLLFGCLLGGTSSFGILSVSHCHPRLLRQFCILFSFLLVLEIAATIWVIVTPFFETTSAPIARFFINHSVLGWILFCFICSIQFLSICLVPILWNSLEAENERKWLLQGRSKDGNSLSSQ